VCADGDILEGAVILWLPDKTIETLAAILKIYA
jgi:hypothetical protein